MRARHCAGLCSSYLIAFRWSGVSSVGIWSVTLCCALITLVSGELTHFSGLLVLLTIQSLIMGAINSSSKDGTQNVETHPSGR
jgi:hypothetical protein